MCADVRHWIFDEGRFVAREMDGDFIVLDLPSGDYFTLDGVAGFAFKRALEGRAFEEVLADVCSEYEADEAAARRDLERLFADLEARKILKPSKR